MKIKIALGTTCLIVILSGIMLWVSKPTDAVTDTCSGVQTTFTASYPSSVVQGSGFTVTGITSQPATSYGVTVTSATLSMNATNATPSSYSMNNSYTVPSPTTGANTYTGYYPDWALTASGNAGSQISITLTQAVAEVTGIGTITCNLTATLATIDITEPASSGGGPSGGGSGGSSSGSTSGGNPTTSPTSSPSTTTQGNTPSSNQSGGSSQTSQKVVDDGQGMVLSTTIFIKNNKGDAVQNAKVAIDGGQVNETDVEGKAVFTNLALGNHKVVVDYNGRTTEQTIVVDSSTSEKGVTIVIPVSSAIFPLKIIVPSAILLIASFSVLAFLLWKKRKNTSVPFTPSPVSSTQSNTFVGVGTSFQPTPTPFTPTVISPSGQTPLQQSIPTQSTGMSLPVSQAEQATGNMPTPTMVFSPEPVIIKPSIVPSTSSVNQQVTAGLETNFPNIKT